MESKSESVINIVIYAETKDAAENLAGKILSSRVQDTEVWHEKVNGVSVNAYIRAPGETPSASPTGITDILLVHLESSESNEWTSVKRYVDARKGIPFKFVTSSNDLTECAKSIDCEFLSISEVTGAAKEKLVRSALDLEETLRNVFNKIDTDKDGSIDSSEILNISKELGHPLNDEDAKEISKSLSKDGKISFLSFKQWWVMKKADFNSFRKIVEVELVLSNLIKKSSEAFNSYLEKLQQDGEQVSSQETGFFSQVNITPEEDFNAGLALGGNFSVGSDFDSIASTFPNYLKESPASFGLEIKLKNETDGGLLIQTLEGVKEMALSFSPEVANMIESGLQINFRHIASSVFVDLSIAGVAGDKINGVLSLFNPSSLNFSGTSDFHITTKLSPVDALNLDFDQTLNNFSNIKIEAKGEYTHLKTFSNFLVNTLTTLSQGSPKEEIKALSFFLRLATIIRKINFTFKYDPDVIVQMLKEFPSQTKSPYSLGAEFWNDATRNMIQNTISQFSSMGQMMLGPFLEGILAIDLDDISVYATLPIIKLYGKLSLAIRGLSQFVSTNLSS